MPNDQKQPNNKQHQMEPDTTNLMDALQQALPHISKENAAADATDAEICGEAV